MQKEAAALRADADELRAQIADLEEQVAEATTQLKLETEAKITAQDEMGQVKECLEASMSSCQKLKEQNEEQSDHERLGNVKLEVKPVEQLQEDEE